MHKQLAFSSVSVCKGVPHWALLKESRLQVTNFLLLLLFLLLHTANTVVPRTQPQSLLISPLSLHGLADKALSTTELPQDHSFSGVLGRL